MSAPARVAVEMKEVVTTQPTMEDENIRPPPSSTDDDEPSACFKCYGPFCLCLQIVACIAEICCVLCDCRRK